jgi:TRAP-type mannitol/chloroaromatic compound transport system substrate-binding protein
MINKKKYDALPDDLKLVLKNASSAASAEMQWKCMQRMSQDFIELQTQHKVNVYRTPRPILDAQLKAWDAVIKKRSADNPLFVKVIESQKAWAKRVMYWHNAVQVNQEAAYAHYFGKGPLA